MFDNDLPSFYDAKALTEEWMLADRNSMKSAAKLLTMHLSDKITAYIDESSSITIVWNADKARRAVIWVNGLLSISRSVLGVFSRVQTTDGVKIVESTMSLEGDALIKALMQSGAIESRSVTSSYSLPSSSRQGVSYEVVVRGKLVGSCSCPSRTSNCRHRKRLAGLLGLDLNTPGNAPRQIDSWRDRVVEQAKAAGNILRVPYDLREVAKQNGGIWVPDLKAWAFKSRAALSNTRRAFVR